jgi:chromosome segregation ATPase
LRPSELAPVNCGALSSQVHLAKTSVTESDGTVSWIPYRFRCTLYKDGSRTYKIDDATVHAKDVEKKLRKLNIRRQSPCCCV